MVGADQLSEHERAGYRWIRLHAGRSEHAYVGLVGLWVRRRRGRSGTLWRVQLNLAWVCAWVQVESFAVYEERLLSDPWRNA